MRQHRVLDCDECGERYVENEKKHECDPGRRVKYQYRLREVDKLESELGTFLETNEGQFDVYYAERDRRRKPRLL